MLIDLVVFAQSCDTMKNDDFDDMILNDKERKTLQNYNINTELDVVSTGRSRRGVDEGAEENLLCRCEGHSKRRCSEKCTSVLLFNLSRHVPSKYFHFHC